MSTAGFRREACLPVQRGGPQPNSMSCRCFNEYMAEARARLVRAVEENKWYLSERAGHDVGYQAAVDDFLNRHFDRFARELRLSFCLVQCKASAECALARSIGGLRGLDAALDQHAAHAVAGACA